MARIEELRHHIRVESAVQEGAEKAIKLLKNFKSVDKKPLQEVWKSYLCYMYTHRVIGIFIGSCRGLKCSSYRDVAIYFHCTYL